jgi:hypothetical protein
LILQSDTPIDAPQRTGTLSAGIFREKVTTRAMVCQVMEAGVVTAF